MQRTTCPHTSLTSPPRNRELAELIEPLAAYITAADDPRAAWAGTIAELFAQVMAINGLAEAFLQQKRGNSAP